MPRQARDHVYRSRREGERCRSRSHDKVWDQATGRKPICDACGRCFWCADPDRCSGRKNSGVEPAGADRLAMGQGSAGGRDLGLVRRERHQSRRTNATGWRWYFLCGCHGYTANPPDGHGFETRKKAGEALAYHMARERQGLPT